jgi:tetratricopeptide (TPR) repeat protein
LSLILGFAASLRLCAAEADPSAIAAHALDLEKQHKYAEAVAEYDELVKMFPRTANPLTMRGWAKHLAGDNTGGLADLGLALATKPGDSAALNRRALINQQMQFWGSAAEDFAAIARQSPADTRSRRNLADCLMMDGK